MKSEQQQEVPEEKENKMNVRKEENRRTSAQCSAGRSNKEWARECIPDGFRRRNSRSGTGILNRSEEVCRESGDEEREEGGMRLDSVSEII